MFYGLKINFWSCPSVDPCFFGDEIDCFAFFFGLFVEFHLSLDLFLELVDMVINQWLLSG